MNVTLSVFELSRGYEDRAREVVAGLASEHGYGAGISVTRQNDSDMYDMYCVEVHRGEITDEKGLVKIIGAQIWSVKFGQLIESALRKKEIGYHLGRFNDERDAALKRTEKYIFSGNIEITYTPVEPLDLTKKNLNQRI